MAKFDFPTEIVDLPSKGKLYPTDHPLSKGTVEIKYMTAREEDILASQNLIRKGVVLDKLFESVVVEEGLDIGDIFIGDKNAILLATRVLGYGKDYQVEVTDPFTGETQKETIDLSQIQIKEVDDSILSADNRYTVTLPISKKEVVLKLLTHKDELDINAEIQALQRLQKKGSDVVSQELSTRLRYIVQEVDGLPVPGDLAANGDFREGRVLACDPLIGVVKNQLNAGLGRGFAGIGAVENDVRDGLTPELLCAALPHHPAYRVNHVGFTAPVGPHNGREVDR